MCVLKTGNVFFKLTGTSSEIHGNEEPHSIKILFISKLLSRPTNSLIKNTKSPKKTNIIVKGYRN
jgi:hypothetical protein